MVRLMHVYSGVREAGVTDDLGQQYLSAEDAIGVRHSDIIIVGRGIYTVSQWLVLSSSE